MKRSIKIVLCTLMAITFIALGATSMWAYYRWIQPHDSPSIERPEGVVRTVPANYIPSLWKLDAFPDENHFLSQYVSNNATADLSVVDLRDVSLDGHLESLLNSVFSTKTLWPENLPVGFNPALIMENGKNPGLSVRSLHEEGITGKGVSIGIIDQVLYTEHEEYADRLQFYEEINLWSGTASLHGPAVASLALGKNTGVAPEAHLYFIAAPLAENPMAWQQGITTYRYFAEAIDRFLDLNQTLPDNEKIRVISISRSFVSIDDGYEEITAALKRAYDANVLVISTSDPILGMNRDPMGNSDDRSIYRNGSWQVGWTFEKSKGRLYFPMDARTFATSTGAQDYMYSPSGGWSWVVPYASGLYALCAQVYPEITPDLYWEALMATSSPIETDDGTMLQHVVDPVALISHFRK